VSTKYWMTFRSADWTTANLEVLDCAGQVDALKEEINRVHGHLLSAESKREDAEAKLQAERDKVVALNAEILRTKLDVERDHTLKIDDRVITVNMMMEEAEKERDRYRAEVDEAEERLQKSKMMNLQLINFLVDVLGGGVYPECVWGELKLKQGC
jgi:chromosome segregation ATPase